jgi:hypothetical protein
MRGAPDDIAGPIERSPRRDEAKAVWNALCHINLDERAEIGAIADQAGDHLTLVLEAKLTIPADFLTMSQSLFRLHGLILSPLHQRAASWLSIKVPQTWSASTVYDKDFVT